VRADESKPAVPSTQPVNRIPLMTAVLEGRKDVQRVEVKRIEMAAGLKAGVHLHTCPVIGMIVNGSIIFQIDGQPQQTLRPGDAFFEPANTRILHFDAGDEPTTFVAYYLLGPEDRELIKMLDR
jgi:quercetin dioxygenase-like cupin family protein